MKRDYNDPVYRKFRNDVIKRDKVLNAKCPNAKQVSFYKYTHVSKWSGASALRYEVSNGITLCKRCHNQITGKETHYENLFREIINGKVYSKAPEFTVIKDTREQEGYYFSKFNTCAGMIEHKLDTGDYSIQGLEDKMCVERKGCVEELAINLGSKKHAFINEIE
jgi:hypothetical protein